VRTALLAVANLTILAAVLAGIAGRGDLAVFGFILAFIFGGLALMFPGKRPNGGRE